jgi:uncharacterized damage-inducible protein DinB
MAARPQSFGDGTQLSKALLPEFDHEMQTTRRTLERVPEDKLTWKPHEKSMSMGELATHLATINHWGETIVNTESFDVSSAPRNPQLKSRSEILAAFDSNTANTRKAIAAATDAELLKSWTLLSAGKTVFTLPRIAALRSFIFSHVIHHRGQFSVYLRLNNIPVPSIYGPSADEGRF